MEVNSWDVPVVWQLRRLPQRSQDLQRAAQRMAPSRVGRCRQWIPTTGDQEQRID
jgi:hypothetical protein